MLDLLRKKAQSWVTHVLFGGLIVVFVLFFGYTKLQRQGPHDTVASVNGMPVHQGEYEVALDNNEAYYRQVFQDKMPDRFMEGLRKSTLQQVINRKLLVDFGMHHGFIVSDQELAEHIQSLPFLHKEGAAFDPITYREQFLPALYEHYHINFEEWAREGMLADKVQQSFVATIRVSDDELRDAYRREHTRYTFEVMRFDPERLVKEKKIANEAAAQDAASAVQAVLQNEAARKPLLATYGVTPEKIGPLAVQPHLPFLGVETTPESVHALFALQPGSVCPGGPYHVDKTLVICRLLARDIPAAAEWEKSEPEARKSLTERYQQVLMEQWMQSLLSHAKITRSL